MVFHKILVVEDDTPLALPLKKILEDNDFKVTHVESGEEAVEMYERERPSIVLLDVQLPGIDGFEVLEKIKKIDNSVPVIMMTGTEYNEESQERGYNLRAVCYMPKPAFPKALLSQINSLLNPPEIKRYILGSHRIVIQNNELSIDDEICVLRDKDIKVLSMLLRKQNEEVTRQDLLNSVWHNKVNMENHLDTSISRIKKVLNNYPNIKLKTIYGKGYTILT